MTTEAAQTPISHKKPVFDLKASLSRPLNYEPHKGMWECFEVQELRLNSYASEDVKNPSEGARLIWIKDHNSRSGFKGEVPKSCFKEALAVVYGTICNQ